jgi:hypothetical protein
MKLLLDLFWYFVDVRLVWQETDRYLESGAASVSDCGVTWSKYKSFPIPLYQGTQWSRSFYKWTSWDVAASFILHFQTTALRMKCRRLEDRTLITVLAVWSCLVFSKHIPGNLLDIGYHINRSQWPRGLRRRSTAARPLRSCVRIPLGVWMFICCVCCVL